MMPKWKTEEERAAFDKLVENFDPTKEWNGGILAWAEVMNMRAIKEYNWPNVAGMEFKQDDSTI